MLARHDLVWLRAGAWARLLAQAAAMAAPDATAMACLAHWASNNLPWVVTRQAAGFEGGRADEALALGLAAPNQWLRRRIAAELRIDDVQRVGRFPLVAEIAPVLAPMQRAAWAALCGELMRWAPGARVCGSHAWQLLSGLACLRAGSDLDLLLPVDTREQADRVVDLLQTAGAELPQLDGELLFPEGVAVAWREWAAVRQRSGPSVLVKHLRGVRLQRPEALGA
jgi:phosphoribosyl-dephospho-CoA transferase